MNIDKNELCDVPDARTIRRHDSEGRSPTEIAQLLGITVQSVRNVLSGFVEKGERADQGLSMLDVIRRANSPDQKWPLSELLNAFRFSTRIHQAIKNYCEGRDVEALNVRDVLDIFISDEPSGTAGVVIAPFLGFRNAGVKSFWQGIDFITQLDLGDSARGIWRAKLQRLEQADRMRGQRTHKWSKPVRRVKSR